MVKKLFFSLFLFTAVTSFSLLFADDFNSPVGTWITISDQTHDPSGMISIYKRDDKLYGKIVKIFPGSGRNPQAICEKCPGKFKDKPVLGSEIMWGFVRNGDTVWSNGQILDSKTGNIYQASLTLIDEGKRLKVRGYWGIFWRTQVWVRAESETASS